MHRRYLAFLSLAVARRLCTAASARHGSSHCSRGAGRAICRGRSPGLAGLLSLPEGSGRRICGAPHGNRRRDSDRQSPRKQSHARHSRNRAGHARFRRARGRAAASGARAGQLFDVFRRARCPSSGRCRHSRTRRAVPAEGGAGPPCHARGRHRDCGSGESDESVFLYRPRRAGAAIQRRQAANRPTARGAPGRPLAAVPHARGAAGLFRRSRARSHWPRNRLRGSASADGPACRVERKSCRPPIAS